MIVNVLRTYPDMAYTFRNRFRLGDGYRLDADVQTITLVDSAEDGLVTLQPPERVVEQGTLISQAGELVLQGTGYIDADAALAAGRAWRQCLTAALARDNKAVDLGPDDRTPPADDRFIEDDPPAFLQPLGIGVGDRVILDDYHLLVFPTDPQPKFVNFTLGTPTVTVSGWLERFDQKIRQAREHHHQPWDQQKTLAFRLVHLSLADTNPETRHVQLVTAVEVILNDQNRPQPILDALDALLTHVDEWPDEGDVKGRIGEILRQAKEESITHAGSDQVSTMLEGTYGDQTAGDFFKRAYDIRSRLVHRKRRRGKPRPSSEELSKMHSDLLNFVLDALDAYGTATPGRQGILPLVP